MARQIIDALDRKILQLIQSDARIPFLEVARACNVSGAAIHQRIQKLTALGIIKGSQFIIDPEKIGFETCAYVGLYLKDPEKFWISSVRYPRSRNVTTRRVVTTCSSRSMRTTTMIC